VEERLVRELDDKTDRSDEWLDPVSEDELFVEEILKGKDKKEEKLRFPKGMMKRGDQAGKPLLERHEGKRILESLKSGAQIVKKTAIFSVDKHSDMIKTRSIISEEKDLEADPEYRQIAEHIRDLPLFREDKPKLTEYCYGIRKICVNNGDDYGEISQETVSRALGWKSVSELEEEIDKIRKIEKEMARERDDFKEKCRKMEAEVISLQSDVSHLQSDVKLKEKQK
jgi:hypothetical protein